MQGKVFIAHKFCSKWNIDITCMRFEILSSQGLLTEKNFTQCIMNLAYHVDIVLILLWFLLCFISWKLYSRISWFCVPDYVFFYVEDEIFQLNVSFILIYGWFFVQIIIYVTFIRNREFVFQIFTFLCLHELYMAYAWSKWSRLKLFPSNWINHTFRFKGFFRQWPMV